MTSYNKYKSIKEQNQSSLCIGLDSDIEKLPVGLSKDTNGMLDFNKAIIDATSDIVCAYKINFAFYEVYGSEGFEILKKTFEYIPDKIFTIADAKRGDIGNTSRAYAKSVFEYFKADSITVNPYMGLDSVKPFLDFTDKLVFILALTSNQGSHDFQRLPVNQIKLYNYIINTSINWGNKENLGFVIGATHPDELKEIRCNNPQRIFLIPGIGTQGGDISEVLKANNKGDSIINISRDIIYASSDDNYSLIIRNKALHYKELLNYSI